ncbi:Toprim domain-containing protein [Bacteroides heparinolyticus]|uniref:Toprim domain-containing protein n=1 Tax=Prevotella heparinolytica TaxID=28113 RepID=A0A4V2SF46_9BACE|nr:AAA family ATPase [Bacteroides heparinolyticus]TCO95917.1 Toprim domain-containing protein [Bacteroides heparinolyticus]
MLSKDEILRRTNNGLDVFRHYIPVQWRVGRNFLNPLYEDRKASCNVYFDRHNNIYRIKDFGNDTYSGDCFFFVGKLKGLDCNNGTDFVEILKTINRDMSLHLEDAGCMSYRPSAIPLPQKNTPLHSEPPKSKPYHIIQQKFSQKELDFWFQSGITPEILKQYKVISLKEFRSENRESRPFGYISSDSEPIFGYMGKRYIKIYRPFSEVRFLYGGMIGEGYCLGLEQLPSKGDTLFITGGEKDVMTLAAHGFHAICFNSETSTISPEIIYKLTFRFKHIVLLYDVDKTGREAALRHEKALAEYDVKRLILPLSGDKKDKDVTDYFHKGNGHKEFQKLFIDLLDNLYNETMTMLKSCEIDFNNPPAKAEEVISAGDVPLGTQGNILCITGGEGTGKSNYIASLIAGSIIKDDRVIDTLGVNIRNNADSKAVLLYDTEQSEVQLFKNVSNLLKRAKLKEKPEELRAFSLTGMSRKERLQAIVQSMDKYHYEYEGIRLVVIDGIADLVLSANDEAESIRIVDELYRLAGIYRTCIVCVLHYVPNGLKLRGHLGSELQRKAAAILSIELDTEPSVSVVKALKVRDGSPLDVPLMQFAWNKEIGMHTYLGEKPREEKEKRKEKELANVAREIFGMQKHLTYIDLCDRIQQTMDVKERTAKSYIKYMREKEIIIKDPSNQNYFIIGHII